jgi:hypothetical protein
VPLARMLDRYLRKVPIKQNPVDRIQNPEELPAP